MTDQENVFFRQNCTILKQFSDCKIDIFLHEGWNLNGILSCSTLMMILKKTTFFFRKLEYSFLVNYTLN